MNNLERVQKLIEQGHSVLLTHKTPPPNVIGFPTLDDESFSNWKIRCLSFLDTTFAQGNPYFIEFKEKVKSPYNSSTKVGLGILTAVKEDLSLQGIVQANFSIDSMPCLENLCNKFHLIVRQLRHRHNSRATLNVEDEYDVQDLFHSILHLNFEDIRPEEWAPSNAGKSTRVDFLLKREKIVVELKKTRNGLGAKEIGSQLIEDIHRYKSHPDCETLLCFVYDPEGRVANPRGLEADLNQSTDNFKVKVIIRP